MKRFAAYASFLAAAALAFLVSTLGFDVVARVAVAQRPVADAWTHALAGHLAQPTGALLLALPFIAAGALAAEAATSAGARSGIAVFAAVAGILGWMYFRGYTGQQEALAGKQWTAAALSVGLLPFRAIPVILVAALATGWIAWRARRRAA